MKDKPLSFQIWIVTSIFNTIGILAILTILIGIFYYYNILTIEPINIELIYSIVELFICATIVNIVISKVISERITEPIKEVEEKMKEIAHKKWDKNDIVIDRQDEIGTLHNSLVNMKNNLIKKEKEEEFFLQSISHGLKTPIMVIKNCCQALKDGIYIHDSEDETINVIVEETDNLQDTVKKFLMINSFEYLLGKKSDFKEIQIRRLLLGMADRFSAGNKELNIRVEGEEYAVWGTVELVKNAVDNIFENAVRYAYTYIKIVIEPEEKNENKYILISISNDGDTIPNEILSHFFEKFYRGRDGNFGLGLYITKRIIEFHEGEVWAENNNGCVKFIIKMKRVN